MDLWVGYAHLFVTTALVCIVAFYGRKYGKTFEAAKQSEIEAKNAWIARLEGELKLISEMSSENVRKHTIALKEQLDERIKMLEEEKVGIMNCLETERSNTQAQQSRIADLEMELTKKDSEIEKAREVASIPAWQTGLLGMIGATRFQPTDSLLSSGPKLLEIIQKIEEKEKLIEKARDSS